MSATPLFYPKQTNNGLYCQLHAAGHPTAEILRVQHAYRLCSKLFNGRFRKTERAFICHAVGAGSSMAYFDRRIDLIIASMLHAAYDSGQFPDGRIGLSDAHRQWLKAQVGEITERLVRDYLELPFGPGKPEQHAQTGYPEEQREVMLMALTHEVDDMADAGLALAPKYGASIVARAEACAYLARQLGQEALAQTLEGHAQTYTDMAWTAELEAEQLEGFRIAPNMLTYIRLQRDSWRGKAVQVF